MGRATDRQRVIRISTDGSDAATADGAHADGAHADGAHADGAHADGASVGGARGTVRIRTRPDTLVAEEPLEIRVGPAGGAHPPLAVTMRTPGDDLDLAVGFLLTEGIVAGAADVVTAKLCAGTDEPNTYNVVDVTLDPGVAAPSTDLSRHFYTTSSCGICGKASIDAVRTRSRFTVAEDAAPVAAATLAALPERLLSAQRIFARTGGLHAAGLFTTDGELVVSREDVGRHNAVDKVVGWALRERRLPLAGHVLLVSGRASFELAQKAWMAGVPVLAAVSAASTLAVSLAEEAGMTLVGFLRGGTMNAYAGAHRVY